MTHDNEKDNDNLEDPKKNDLSNSINDPKSDGENLNSTSGELSSDINNINLSESDKEPQTSPEDPIESDYVTDTNLPDAVVESKNEVTSEAQEEKKDPGSGANIDSPISETTEVLSGDKAKEEIKNTFLQKDSNYQISLVNENLLKIVVTTDRGVNIDCSVKERKNSKETQSNKIYLHPKPDNIKQEIEIIISIDSLTGEVTVQKKNDSFDEITPSSRLTPNPDVASLVQAFPYEEELTIEKTPDELLDEKLGKKNPYHLFRLFYQRNLTIGIVGAIILQSFMILIFYAFIGKFDNKIDDNENKRLIVISDLPNPKINIKEFEDPNKPKEVPKTEPDSKITKLPGENPFSINRTIKPPRIKRPKINDITKNDSTKVDSTKDLTSQLDSLRKLGNGKNPKDSVKADTSGIANKTPVDTTGQFQNGDVGLYIPYKQLAPYLKLVDSREINKNVQDFEGVLLTDTTKATGNMTMFITLDKTGETFERSFKDKGKPFPMVDSSLTAYYLEPYTQIKRTKYSFYVLGKINKVNITLETRAELFNDYKSIVEQLVKNIRIN
ncbi:hypothetical protein BH10BAC5_BH10BAC5_28140 [soil metagenome]